MVIENGIFSPQAYLINFLSEKVWSIHRQMIFSLVGINFENSGQNFSIIGIHLLNSHFNWGHELL